MYTIVENHQIRHFNRGSAALFYLCRIGAVDHIRIESDFSDDFEVRGIYYVVWRPQWATPVLAGFSKCELAETFAEKLRSMCVKPPTQSVVVLTDYMETPDEFLGEIDRGWRNVGAKIRKIGDVYCATDRIEGKTMYVPPVGYVHGEFFITKAFRYNYRDEREKIGSIVLPIDSVLTQRVVVSDNQSDNNSVCE